jgi:hypothetical protein
MRIHWSKKAVHYDRRGGMSMNRRGAIRTLAFLLVSLILMVGCTTGQSVLQTDTADSAKAFISRERAIELANQHDANAGWVASVGSMQMEIGGQRITRGAWVLRATRPAGRTFILYLDPVTGEVFSTIIS